MSLVICQSTVPCGNQANGKCLLCGTLQCPSHLGPQPGSHQTAFYLWWQCCLTVSGFELYEHAKAEIEQRWKQFPQPSCIICRFKAVWSEFAELAKRKQHEHQQRQARQKALESTYPEWVEQNWRHILEYHRRHSQKELRKVGLFTTVDVWVVDWREEPYAWGDIRDTKHIPIKFITSDNRLIEGYGRPVAFTPGKIDKGHWLYKLAERHALLPRA